MTTRTIPPPPHIRRARPLVAAYALAFVSSASPRLLKTLLLWARGKLTLRAASLQLVATSRAALSPGRFPAFCATLIGGSTLLQLPLALAFRKLVPNYRPRLVAVCIKFVSALISASAAFTLINSYPSSSFLRATAPTHLHVIRPGPFDEPPELGSKEVDDASLRARSLSRAGLAGKSMDLTLFAAVRAGDILISRVWDRMSPSTSKNISAHIAPVALFCFSAATVMHAWFYSPSRLPQAYNKWISAAAELDNRLLLTLRHARYGTWTYGKDTGMADLLGSMCHDYGLREELGDPARTIPIPCELVHMGCGKSCEKHALVRFVKGWAFAARMYAPLQLLVLIRHVKRNSHQQNRLAVLTGPRMGKAIVDTVKSSAFLGAFIAFFYYGVCLSRTRLGPRLFSPKMITPQMWDSGLCVFGGCLLCGMSILVEQSRKRLEILLFVLPRAAATWYPRCYLPEHQWREHFAFALSAAIVLTTAQEDPNRVRGVLGNLLKNIMKND